MLLPSYRNPYTFESSHYICISVHTEIYIYIYVYVGRICANSADFSSSVKLRRGEPQPTTDFTGITLDGGFPSCFACNIPRTSFRARGSVAQEKPLVKH